MAVDEKWYFTKEQLLQSPSRKSGYDVDKELSCRQQAANFIQDMGQRLQVSQLCINTAIVYMHRFYVFHSLAAFHRNAIAAAALFLAAKVEEQPRKLEHVIKVAHMCLHRENPNLDTKSELYLEQAQDLVFNENVLLQTLGFDVAIDHPHTHVVRCCHLVRASKDLAQTSYFMASNSLHLTTMCLQYKPTVVACFCIHLACKWSNWEIPRSNEGKDWFWYIDKTVTKDLLEQLTGEFLAILDKCPTKLKRKMMSMNQNNTPGFTQQSIPHDGLQFEEPRKLAGAEAIKPPEGLFPIQKSSSQTSNDKIGTSSSSSSSTSSLTTAPSHSHHQKIDYREYREKKERERIEREKQPQQQRDGHSTSSSNHHHHSKTSVISGKSHSNVQSRTLSGSVSHKSYQQPPHGMQHNLHFQKEGRDSNSQGFQSSTSMKDSNYLKQHPSHTERDGNKDSASFHGQYSQNSNLQHQNYPHKSESNYSGNFPHREGSRGSHGVQSSGNPNLPQSHHVHNQSTILNTSNFVSGQRDSSVGGQRENVSKDVDSQSQAKDAMSTSIRDIISQTVSQKDVHSMTSERKEHVRDKSRMNYTHGNSSASNFRPETSKREQVGINFHEFTERKVDDFAPKLKDKLPKKVENEHMMDTVKLEPVSIKTEKFDETDLGDEGTWNFGMNIPNVTAEKNSLPVMIKSEPNSGKNELSVDSGYSDCATSNKSQTVHPSKLYDPKSKGHLYHSTSKNSDISQIKVEKTGALSSNEMSKKLSDRTHDKHRKLQDIERVSQGVEGSGSMSESKHHKLSKDASDKHKLLLPGQYSDQRLKEKMSPSKYQKVRSGTRPPNLAFAKSEPGHFSLETNSTFAISDGERGEGAMQTAMSLKPIGGDDVTRSIKGINSGQKQKSHEFGAPGNLSGSVPDSSFIKSSKPSSIFSPDSKIPPQNILSSLEKDSKKNVLSTHRSHSSKSPTDSSVASAKKSLPSTAMGTMTTTTTTTGSLFSPPLPKNIPSVPPRHRTSSSGSEPELIPVLTKLEDTPGYENFIKEKKKALTPTNSGSPCSEKDKKVGSNESSNSFLFEYDYKAGTKDSKINDAVGNIVKSEVITQSVASKPVVNVKFPNEIRSDLGAVIYPTNPKSASVSKPTQGFAVSESKHSLANSVSTVNLLGIEKMVDTSISPAKQTSQFSGATIRPNSLNSNFNSSISSVSNFGSTVATTTIDQTYSEQNISKVSNSSNQDLMEVDVLGYSEKKRSEKKKKKEKHKHKEKDKDKSERKKEKKKHKDKDKERLKDKEKHKEKHRDKEKHKEKEIDVVSSETPIKITIPKDKISGSLKIKISKDCLKKDEVEPPKAVPGGDLKIKISKDVFSNISTYKEDSKSESKKRERSPKSTSDLPQPKSMKMSDKKSSSSSLKSNGTEGSSRNSTSHKYSVSENGSYFDISSLYDLSFDFEENGQGIIKTPDYDFEALNALEFPPESNTSPEVKEIEEYGKNSHNESKLTKNDKCVVTSEPEASATSPNVSEYCEDISCGDIATDLLVKPISPINDVDYPKHSTFSKGGSTPKVFSTKINLVEKNHFDIKNDESSVGETKGEDFKKDKMISYENCDVLKNYKTILDSHSKRCEPEILKHSVSPVSPEETASETKNSAIINDSNDTDKYNNNNNSSDDNNVNNNNNNTSSNNKNGTNDTVPSSDKTSSKETQNNSETENPNYYNKYFKKENVSRNRSRDEKRLLKGRLDDKVRFDDRQRYYDSRRYRTDYNERDRRDDRRYYRDFRDFREKDSSQYYYERKDDRRFDYSDYSSNTYFNANKTENNVVSLNYDVNANGAPTVYPGCAQTKATPQFSQMCDPSMSGNPADMNVQYQFGYFNNYMYPNGGYRFYGNVPFVNMSLIQQQPMPPGTGDAVLQLEPPPLPLEPPPDLPPPPETPPPPPK